MAYTNAQILSAVIAKFIEPAVQQLGTAKIQTSLSSFPVISGAENWLKKWGLVSPNYSLAGELAGLTDMLSSNIVSQMLNQQIARIDDNSIPHMAHSFVDELVNKGEFSLFEGTITWDSEDLAKLKNLLTKNLPLKEEYKGYTVIE